MFYIFNLHNTFTVRNKLRNCMNHCSRLADRRHLC